jgi:hypothetical protein
MTLFLKGALKGLIVNILVIFLFKLLPGSGREKAMLAIILASVRFWECSNT